MKTLSKQRELSRREVNNLIVRTITGAVFVGLTVASILCGAYLFLAFFAVIVFLGAYEFTSLVAGKTKRGLTFFSAGVAACIFLVAASGKLTNVLWTGDIGYLIIIPLLFLIPIAGLFMGGIPLVRHIGAGMLSAVILPAAFVSLTDILAFSWGKNLLLAFFFIIWSYDTFAYLVGITIGRHRVCEAISPKKSWEGTFGGLVFGIICAVVFYFLTDTLSVWQWMGYAFIICLFGTLGDYCESMFKRSLNVKDSGKILPGHGGILDRFDSAILAGPFALLYLHFIL